MEQNTDDLLRDRLFQSIYEEFVGPSDPTSEEIIDFSPSQRYNAGVLHPRGASISLEAEHDDHRLPKVGSSRPADEESIEHMPATAIHNTTTLSTADSDEFEEPISLSNARAQSALSMTVGIRSNESVAFEIDTATYQREVVDGAEKYRRHPLHFDIPRDEVAVPRGSHGESGSYQTELELDGGKLKLQLVHRRAIEGGDVITIALCNSLTDVNDDYPNCYYQTSFKIVVSHGLIPPTWPQSSATSEEEANKRLIYRNLKNYAIGHGCATSWEQGGTVHWAKTETMPLAETQSMKPLHPLMKGVSLSLEQFGDITRWPETLNGMRTMCAKYEKWISENESRLSSLEKELVPAARKNIASCRTCLLRMTDGISLLEQDSLARKAFVMANKAMYEQYLHYSYISGERPSLSSPPIIRTLMEAFPARIYPNESKGDN